MNEETKLALIKIATDIAKTSIGTQGNIQNHALPTFGLDTPGRKTIFDIIDVIYDRLASKINAE